MRTKSRHLNRLLTFFLIVATVAMTSGTSEAEAPQPSSWGNSPGLTSPQPDSRGRAGYWWWPRSEQGAEHQENWAGNHGRVFGAWQQPMPKNAEEPPPPPPPVEMPPIVCGGVILNNILFDFDKTTLKPEGKAEIDKLVAEMEKFRGDTLVCVGHTDEVGSEAYNLTLGERRAQAVKDYLVERGIAVERIGIRSMGETQPAVRNDSPPNRALNRRVEFELTLGN